MTTSSLAFAFARGTGVNGSVGEEKTAELFSGTARYNGGVSNEAELVQNCPSSFKEKGNPWTVYADLLTRKGGNISDWVWKENLTEDERRRRLSIFRGFCSTRTFDLVLGDKSAVAAWMLSEMLATVPEYAPLQSRV